MLQGLDNVRSLIDCLVKKDAHNMPKPLPLTAIDGCHLLLYVIAKEYIDSDQISAINNLRDAVFGKTRTEVVVIPYDVSDEVFLEYYINVIPPSWLALPFESTHKDALVEELTVGVGDNTALGLCET